MIQSPFDTLRRDLRDAFRSLRRTPAFTLTAILILGVGIGMATAMFTVFEQVVVKRLPVQDQDDLIELSGVAKGAATELGLNASQLHQFRTAQRTLSKVAGYAHWGAVQNTVADGERDIQLRMSAATGNFFQTLGVTPVLGRLFRPEDDPNFEGAPQRGGDNPAAAVLSYDTWSRDFRGDSSVIGRRIRVLEYKYSPIVVGVAPPGLDYPRGVQFWVSNSTSTLDLVARLAPGATISAARADYLAFVRNDPDYAKFGIANDIGTRAEPLVNMVLGDTRPALVALIMAVGVLLLLACVNIGNLLLLRSSGRSREIAVRRAIGASAGAIARQVITESAVLGVAGGSAGLALADLLIRLIVLLAPATLPRLDLLRITATPVVIAVAITSLAVLLFGLLPAAGSLGSDVAGNLRADTRSGTESRRSRDVRRALVATQIAFAIVLLAGAGLVTKSFARLSALDLGFKTGQVAVLSMTMPWDKWVPLCGGVPPATDSARSEHFTDCQNRLMIQYHVRVMDALRANPTVEKISPVSVPPFLGTNVFMSRIAAEGQSAAEAQANPWVGQEFVGPEYFDVMGLPLLKGRAFADADRTGSADVAIVSEGVARLLWPGQDAVGKRMSQAPGLPSWTVVGVVPDIHFREHRHSTPMVFRPYLQTFAQGTLVAKLRGNPASMFAAMRAAVHSVDPDGELTEVKTMDDVIAPQLAQPRLNAMLFDAFAMAAVVLAAVGLYGIMASAVLQQRRELGVRMALGATATQMRGMVVRQALAIAGIGALAGLAGALLGSRLLSSLLFEVSPTDPITLAGVSVLSLLVSWLAAYVPARRATRIDPAVVLKTD